MASSLCKSTVLKVYHEIMDDVVAGVRELFLEDGVDEQILQELKQSWETKLLATKAVDTQSEMEKQIAMVKKESATSNGQVFNHKVHPQQNAAGQHTVHAPAAPVSAPTAAAAPPSAPAPPQQLVLKQEPAGGHAAPPPRPLVAESKQVPIQITLPQQPGANGPRVLTIQVPVSALQGNQLHKVLTGPVITATMGLPHAIASTLLQQHVNAAFNQHHPPPSAVAALTAAASASASAEPPGNGTAHAPANNTTAASAQNNLPAPKTLAQGDAAYDDSSDDAHAPSASPNDDDVSAVSLRLQKRRCRHKRRNHEPTRSLAEAGAVLSSILGDVSLSSLTVNQCDGNLMDTSDEDNESSDEDEPSDEDYANKDEEDEMDKMMQEMEYGPEEEPLNSEDDVTDEDPSELFDTDNVVVCQYDKITRARNKWKFHLKDGIMNLNGEDYVFQKASGDAEW